MRTTPRHDNGASFPEASRRVWPGSGAARPWHEGVSLQLLRRALHTAGVSVPTDLAAVREDLVALCEEHGLVTDEGEMGAGGGAPAAGAPRTESAADGAGARAACGEEDVEGSPSSPGLGGAVSAGQRGAEARMVTGAGGVAAAAVVGAGGDAQVASSPASLARARGGAQRPPALQLAALRLPGHATCEAAGEEAQSPSPQAAARGAGRAPAPILAESPVPGGRMGEAAAHEWRPRPMTWHSKRSDEAGRRHPGRRTSAGATAGGEGPLVPVSTVVRVCIERPLREASAWLGRAAVVLFVEHHQLGWLLRTCRRYFLGAAGDFLSHLTKLLMGPELVGGDRALERALRAAEGDDVREGDLLNEVADLHADDEFELTGDSRLGHAATRPLGGRGEHGAPRFLLTLRRGPRRDSGADDDNLDDVSLFLAVPAPLNQVIRLLPLCRRPSLCRSSQPPSASCPAPLNPVIRLLPPASCLPAPSPPPPASLTRPHRLQPPCPALPTSCLPAPHRLDGLPLPCACRLSTRGLLASTMTSSASSSRSSAPRSARAACGTCSTPVVAPPASSPT